MFISIFLAMNWYSFWINKRNNVPEVKYGLKRQTWFWIVPRMGYSTIIYDCSPYQLIFVSQSFRFEILVSMPSIINPNIKHNFFYPISGVSIALSSYFPLASINKYYWCCHAWVTLCINFQSVTSSLLPMLFFLVIIVIIGWNDLNENKKMMPSC